ncbi:XRE family transcriptional regulator [Novosphingobium fuchskuhlense]|uniref:XRE family transcriptional regulator n=1 Tax=Novosphingobium fuchskuhlense TaxID=1117702 RepID=A0A124JU68_9SPHN|nr:response regulator transcription factor [Novosphingobium fuchskuhlense]KUR70922.1 XRE family transcriptional regulator [Novosphingobium fuchskuhlense]
MTAAVPRVLLVEDEAEAAELVIEALVGGGFDTEWHASAAAGLAAAIAGTFDAIVLDRMLPEIEGLSIVRRLRAEGIAAPILLLSALARSENRVEGLDAGADDYIGKPFEPSELVARVRALLRRTTNPVTGVLMLYGEIELHVKARTAHRQGRHVPLSPKEFDILKFMMDHAGDMVTREMLLREVWGLSFDPQTNVIDVAMSRLRQRLDEGFATSAIETVRGAGFRLVGHA